MRSRFEKLFAMMAAGVMLVTSAQIGSAQTPAANASAQKKADAAKFSIERAMPVVTQGPFWPPSELVDKDGNYVLVGQVLTEVAPNTFAPVPSQAVLVSKDTVPALDKNGVEDPSNWFGAAYKVIRQLDLRPGSPDLNIVLYSNSFGPAGSQGQAPRIPMAGESRYNLNGDFEVCKELFPTASQRLTFTRPSFPLHKVPVLGFQGDQVAYDVETGAAYDPSNASGAGCGFFGCPGEDVVDEKREDPITLGEWLQARGSMKITLTRFNKELNAYTHARFDFKLRNLLPNSLYTPWLVRMRQVPFPDRNRRDIDPIATPNTIVTDAKGNADASYEVANPFPDPATDFRGMRIIGVAIVYHSDHQTYGACFDRFGPGVSAHAVLNTLGDGTVDIAPGFITSSASAR